MTSETLQYLTIDPCGTGRWRLVVQTNAGGHSVPMHRGMNADAVVGALHDLADRLAAGITLRSAA